MLKTTEIYCSNIFLVFFGSLLGAGLFEIELNSFEIYLKEKTPINDILINLKMFNLA